MPNPEILPIGVEGTTAGALNSLRSSVPMSAGVAEAVASGPVAPSIVGTLANTAFLVGGLFLAYKGVEMIATGRNSFKKESIA